MSQCALDKQVGGDHYSKLRIQPVEFIHQNNIPFIEGNVIKYVTRWRSKNGIKDLEKAKHYLELLIELENRNAREGNPEEGHHLRSQQADAVLQDGRD